MTTQARLLALLLGWNAWPPTAGPAAAQFPDDAQVTFQTTAANGRRTLWRLQAKAGAAPENLTTKLNAIALVPGDDAGPITVSPDGAWYLFASGRFATDAGGATVLTIAPADFSSAESIRTPNGLIYNEGMAQATAGGNTVVFSDSGGTHTRDLFVAQRQAGGWSLPVQITTNSAYAFNSWPVLSSDGSKVVFNASPNDQYGAVGTVVAEVGLDGAGFRVLVTPADGPNGNTNSPYCSFPAYSPDGSNVYFEAQWNGSEQVWRRAVAGGAPALVNAAFTDDNSPNVLPDGRIASLWLGSPSGNGLHEIKIMNPDGLGAMMVTSTNSPFTEVDDIGVGAGLLWAPTLAAARNGEAITVSWPSRFTNLVLQTTANLTQGGWTEVPATGNAVDLHPTNSAAWFRMTQKP